MRYRERWAPLVRRIYGTEWQWWEGQTHTWTKEKGQVTCIKHSFSDKLPSTQSMVHGLNRPIVDEEVVRSDIGILREAVKAFRDSCEGTWVGEFVED